MTDASIDLSRARRDTPLCEKVLHFNNAGVGLMPRPVLNAITAHLQLEAEVGPFEAADLARADVEHVYDAASQLIGCQRDEIAVIEDVRCAWEMAFASLPLKSGDRILTSASVYPSNFSAFRRIAQKTGVKVEVIPNDSYGQVSVAALQDMLDAHVKLITITHVLTNNGLVNPAREIGKMARQAGVLFLLDACQSIGQMPIEVSSIGCDMLSAIGRKYLRGPRGAGFLYVRRDLLEQLELPSRDSHTAEWGSRFWPDIQAGVRRFEYWHTHFTSKRIGLGAAIDYALGRGLDCTWTRISSLAGTLRNRLSRIPRVSVRDLGQHNSGIVTFTLGTRESQEVRRQLAKQQINVSDAMDDRGLARVVRASVHYYNTEEEIDRFCNAVSAF